MSISNVQGVIHAEHSENNGTLLRVCRYDVPLVADIHFQPQVAMMVAEAFEKIRINPGNFADGRKTFEVINYDDPAQFKAEQEQIREVGRINSEQAKTSADCMIICAT